MKSLVALLVLLMGTTAYAAAPARVLTLPFESVGEAAKPWIAKAVQQNLQAELSRLSSVTTVAGDTPITDVSVAVRLGEGQHVDYVVFGSYQVVEGDLRLTGHVVDVAKKESIAGLKATGTQRDLFGLEDVIANQVKRSLPQPVVVQAEMLKQPVEPPPAPEPPAPEVAANERARQLEQEIDRAIDRLKYATPDYTPYDYYPTNYGYYSGIYQPFVYYTYPSFPRRYPIHHHHHGGHWGGIGGRTWTNYSAYGPNIKVGGGVGYGVPRGSNYVNYGRMSR
jgi:TolB-like protein